MYFSGGATERLRCWWPLRVAVNGKPWAIRAREDRQCSGRTGAHDRRVAAGDRNACEPDTLYDVL